MKMNRFALILLLITLSFAATAANTPPPGNTGNIITNGGSGRYGTYTVGPGLSVVGNALTATSTSSASPSGIFPQIQYNDGAGNFAPLTEYTAAAYAAHNTIMNGLAYDPRDTQYGALCGGFNLFSGNGTTATFNYTIPFTGSSSTDNSGFFVYIETNGFASATILTTADFTVTGVNSGVGGTITLNTPPVAGSTLIVVHDDGPGLIATSTASVASGGYISVPHGCTMYTDAAAGTALADNVQVIGQGFTPNYAQQEQTMKPILYVIAPTGHAPPVGFNISNKNKQFFEGFEITTHIPGASNQFGFQTVPALIGVVGNTGAGGGTLPGITAQYMTFNYGNVGFGAPKSGTAQYIFSTLRFNTFSANDAGVYGPLSDQQIYGNNFDQNGQFGTYGNSGGMVIGPQQGASGASGASRVEFNRFEFNLEGIVVKAGNLITMDGNEFDSNYGCGLDLNSSWSDININGGWFRASGTNGSNGPGNTTAGRDAHVCINGAGYNLHITGTNFLNGYLRGYQQPIGTASANTPLYFMDVNTAGSGVDNISVANTNIQNSFTATGAYVRDLTIYRNGIPSNVRIDSAGQPVTGKIANGSNPSQARGLPANKWSDLYLIGDANGPYGSQIMPLQFAYGGMAAKKMNIGPTYAGINNFSVFDCDIVNTAVTNTNLNTSTLSNLAVAWLPSSADPGYGSGFYQSHEADTNSCRLGGLTWMSVPKDYKIYAQSGCTPTGTWTNSASYTGYYGLTSSTNGDSLSCPVTTNGGPIYLWYLMKGSNGGTFQWSLDSTTTGSVAVQGNNAFTFPINTSSQTLGAVRIPVNTGAGSHTIGVSLTSTTSTSNAVTIEGLGTPPGIPEHGSLPSVFLGGQILTAQNGPQPAAVAAFNSDQKTQANQLFSDGLSVNFADVQAFLPTTTVNYILPGGNSKLTRTGQSNVAKAFLSVMQPEKISGALIDPRDYGASCNSVLLSNTYTVSPDAYTVSFTAGSNALTATATGSSPPITFDPTVATQFGGGNVGQQIGVFADCDPGPTTYIASVTTSSNTLNLGWPSGAACSGTGYALITGYPANPNDPSTAQDDTNAFNLAEIAASVGGGKVFAPTYCAIGQGILGTKTPLTPVKGVTIEGNSATVAYGNPNFLNRSPTVMFINGTGYGDDILYGIKTNGTTNVGFKNISFLNQSFDFTGGGGGGGFTGLALSAIGHTGNITPDNQLVLLDGISANNVPTSVGVPIGINLPVAFTGSITGTTLNVLSITSTGFSIYGAPNGIPANGGGVNYMADSLALGRTITGVGVPVGETIVSAPSGLNTDFGIVSTTTISSGGTGYTNGTYSSVPLTGGTGRNALSSTVVVSGGAVTSAGVSAGTRGQNYTLADVLSADAATIGGTGSGFALTVTATAAGGGCCQTGQYTVSMSATTSVESMTSPGVSPSWSVTLRNSQLSVAVANLNGCLSDSDIDDTVFSNFNNELVLGPPDTVDSNGCGANRMNGGRFEGGAAGGACTTQIPGQSFLCTGGNGIQFTGTQWQFYGGSLINNCHNINYTGGLFQDDVPQEITLKGSAANTHDIAVDGVSIEANFHSPTCPTYLFATGTGSTADNISVTGGHVPGVQAAMTNFANGTPAHYKQDVPGYPYINTTQPITVGGALTLTTTKGGASYYTGLSNTTTNTGTIVISGLKPVNGSYDCSGGNLTTGNAFAKGLSSTTSCSLGITTTVTSTDALYFKAPGGN